MVKTIVRFFLLASIGTFTSQAFTQGLEHLQEYTLSNGLTVILNQDNNKPEVFGYMVCKAGGKDDPADATGMAHYMEHMLFKGTTSLGTTNWTKEKIHIDSIFLLYDILGKTTDEKKRKEVQLLINEQSVLANQYAIPNELANLIRQQGGTNMNANTSPDRTVFFNTFPPNQIERWLELYAHRFENAVFRSFQAELEVVYEEKNMHSDMFFQNMFEDFQKHFFKNHPYGQQTLIGSINDLKNPSLNKMYEFYRTWYVPNNMALVLCGDFDTELVKPLIEKTFGKWQFKELPQRKHWTEVAFNGREFAQVKMSPVKIGMLGFRTVPKGDPDEIVLQVCNGILSNESSSGLMDQLILKNELLEAKTLSLPFYDYGMSLVLFVPKVIGQSLESAEKLVLGRFDSLKEGKFDEWRVEAIKKELYRQHQVSMEKNAYRGISIGEYFARGANISELQDYPSKINAITKEDVVRVANKYYGDNFLAYYSKMGSAKKEKIKKPGYKPVISNTTAKSAFSLKLDSIAPYAYTPKYIDLDKSIASAEIQKGVKLYVTNNPQNDIFSLTIRFHAGYKEIPLLKYAIPLMDLASTKELVNQDFKSEVAKIGATYEFETNEGYTTITLQGIESELGRALYLINTLINQPVINQKDIKTMVDGEKAGRKLERSEPDNVATALNDWVKYGNKSDALDRLTIKEIASLNADSLTKEFLKVTNYEVELHYVGKNTIDDLIKAIAENLKFKSGLTPVDEPIVKPIQEYSQNMVFFVHKKKATQSKIYFLENGNHFNLKDIPIIQGFNLYFGNGFTGLVLQEIREYRSLAYTSDAAYKIPERFDIPANFIGYIGTQADKTTEALSVFMDLVRKMPDKPERMNMIRPYLELSSLTKRPDFRELSTYIVGLKQQGYQVDPAMQDKDSYRTMSFDDIRKFYLENIQDKPMVISIVGNKKQIDMKELEKYGKLSFIKEKNLFKN
jgi:zinc protease